FALRDVVQAFQNVVGLNKIAFAVVLEWMALLELGDMVDPCRKVLLESPAGGQQVAETVLCICNVGPRDLLHLSDLGGIDIDVRDVFCVWRKLSNIAGHAIVKT